MKRLLLLLLFFAPLFVQAQPKGIHFEHGNSWADVQAKARAENKYIFMDCFTTWCGPCKYMSANIFPLENVGNFMNDKFILVKVQLDTTVNDDDEVKSWYKTGHDLASEYQVRAYPTYLIFNEKGEIVDRFVGASEADAFLVKVKNALNPEMQYYTLLKGYKAGKKDTASLRKMALAAANAYDMENARAISNEYLATQKDLFTKDNLEFIKTFTQSSEDKGFNIILNNADKVNKVLGAGSAESMVQQIIMGEEIFRKFPNDPSKKPDWTSISADVRKKYPAQASEAIDKAKVMYYRGTNDWNNFQTAIVSYMNNYGSKVPANELNEYAWAVFENCNDIKCVEQALEWSKRSIKDNNEPMFIDTYANILYKLGKKDKAITWEQKALDLAPAGDKKTYQETLDKMKNGEKTWN